jgi:hypothetical protein
VQIVYASRARGDTTDRVVSPQRLVHYRDNWYLDAYCHLRERLSTFSIDAMVRVQALKESAIEISGQEISFPYSDTRELMMVTRHPYPPRTSRYPSGCAICLSLPCAPRSRSRIVAGLVSWGASARPESRLSCQVVLSQAFDGLEVDLPVRQY